MNEADHFENEFIADALLDSVTFGREKLVEIINKCTKVASENSCDAALKVCCVKPFVVQKKIFLKFILQLFQCYAAETAAQAKTN